MKWILTATDSSEPAKRAERYAAELAARLGDGLLLAYVVEPPPVPPEGSFPLTEMLSDHEAWADRYLRDASAGLARPGLEVKCSTSVGTPAEELARLAADPEVELVVVGSRGRGAVARLLLGSVASRLSQICPKPLLILRGGEPGPAR